jgi:hypothetical protein
LSEIISFSFTRVVGLNNGDVGVCKQRPDEGFLMYFSFPVGEQTNRQVYMPTAKYTAVICVILEGLA